MAEKVLIKQFKNKAKKPVAGLTPEHAIYDKNGVRLDAKLGNVNLQEFRDLQQQGVSNIKAQEASSINTIEAKKMSSVQAVADREAEILAKSDAAEISFNNTSTSFSSTNVQDTLAETDGKVTKLEERKGDNILFLNSIYPNLKKIIKSVRVYSEYERLYVMKLIHSENGRLISIKAVKHNGEEEVYSYYVVDSKLIDIDETVRLGREHSSEVIELYVTWGGIYTLITDVEIEINPFCVIRDYNTQILETQANLENTTRIAEQCYKELESEQKVIEIKDFSDTGKFLYEDSYLESSGYNITPYIEINNVSRIELENVYSGTNGVFGYVLYDADKNIIETNPIPESSIDHNYVIENDGLYKYVRCTQQAGHQSLVRLISKSVGLKDNVSELNNTLHSFEGTIQRLSRENTLYNKKWLLIGDSITEHNFRTEKNYHDYIKEELCCETINFGVSGAGYRLNNREELNFEKILDKKMSEHPETAPDFVTIMGGINDMMFDTSLIGDITDKSNETLLGSVYCLLQRINYYFPNIRVGILTPIAEIQMPNIDNNTSVRYKFNIGESNPISSLNVGDAYFGTDHNGGLFRYEVTEVHLDNGVGYFYAESHVQDVGYPACRALPVNGGMMTRLDGTGDENIIYDSATSNVLNIFVKKLKEFCEYHNVMFLDQYHCTGLRPWDSAYNEQYFKSSPTAQADGLHPNAEGHKLIYPRIREFLKTMI